MVVQNRMIDSFNLYNNSYHYYFYYYSYSYSYYFAVAVADINSPSPMASPQYYQGR